MSKPWRDRVLSSTRGRVLSLLRLGPSTVNELAAALTLTDNAVRAHLAGLERDGLVRQDGVRRGFGKPAHVFRMTAEAESLFPKAYAAVLVEVLALLRERQGRAGLEELLREVGRRVGTRAREDGATVQARAEAAARVLGELGGLAEVLEDETGIRIQGYSCPLAAVVGAHPETCALAEQLVSEIVGVPVRECCDRSGEPRCSFSIPRVHPA